MSIKRTVTAASAIAAVAAGLVAGTATPVHAADYTFAMNTASIPGGGFGQLTQGSLTWVNNKHADVTGRVTDRCNGDANGDGRGVYLYARATYGNGTQRAEFLWGDNNGCSDSAAEGLYTHSVYNPENRNITAVQVRICYNDGMPANWADCERMATTAVLNRP